MSCNMKLQMIYRLYTCMFACIAHRCIMNCLEVLGNDFISHVDNLSVTLTGIKQGRGNRHPDLGYVQDCH